ncbi:hypothetical protein N7541_009156 [Penicillium brevicompactum]|uniref:Uncharacterized protein n=1 Tax=Penicillium brevicompactum TaxID=5074 RepID=A0A9W9UMV1_PENBR|nr:hypothetical protein N7541_009156 [Penicillium brevicompactum]
MQRPQPSFPARVHHFTLAKFSHTTTLIDHVGPLTWNHVTGNGELHCIFEKIADPSLVSSSLIQKVLRGNDMLEQVDLVYQIRLAAMSAQLVPIPKSHFAVVVKSPCIAVKYPERETHIRRFQIKFSTEHDYFMALALLGEINCPLIEGNSPVPAIQRFPSVSSWTSGSLSSIVPRGIHQATMAHGSNGMQINTGMIGSGGTTPIRASSPASTVSYSLPGFSHHPPAVVQPTLAKGPEVVDQPPHGPTTILDAPSSSLEAPNSQLSSVSAIHDMDQLNQMLPPKRDLPFSKPAAKRARTANAARTTQAKKKKSPFNEPHPPNPSDSPKHRPVDTTKGLYTGPGASETQSQNPSQSDSCHPMSQPQMINDEPPMSSQMPPTEALIDCLPPVSTGQQLLPMQRHIGISNTPSQPNKQEEELGPRAVQAMMDDQLTEYLAHPTPERIAFLENWMCELIEDDGFMTLCQDVEGTWRRFAFGRNQ